MNLSRSLETPSQNDTLKIQANNFLAANCRPYNTAGYRKRERQRERERVANTLAVNVFAAYRNTNEVLV